MINYCFVFARGGSKGLPGKNLLKINGVSLVGHAINTAKSLDKNQEVFLSTDSDEIANIGKKYGALIIERPSNLADDTAAEWDAWNHAITHVEDKYGQFDKFISLPPTSPCRRIEDVRKCIDKLDDTTDIVITTTASHRNPWFNMVIQDKANYVKLVNSESTISRRQDCPKCLDIATVAYAAHPQFIKQNKGIWDGNVKSVEVPKYSSVDIDTLYDYAIAKLTLENKQLIELLSENQ